MLGFEWFRLLHSQCVVGYEVVEGEDDLVFGDSGGDQFVGDAVVKTIVV
jgi:hypothetical protein